MKCKCGNPAKVGTNSGDKCWKCYMGPVEYKKRFGEKGVKGEN